MITKNIVSQPQELKNDTVIIPHMYSSDEARAIQYANMAEGYCTQLTTVHSLAQGYERNREMKDAFHNNMFK